MRLTPAQRSELQRLVTLKMPDSWKRWGFPGIPMVILDMRSVEALEKRGLVESVVHRWDAGDGERVVVTYRATAAGLAANDSPRH